MCICVHSELILFSGHKSVLYVNLRIFFTDTMIVKILLFSRLALKKLILPSCDLGFSSIK